MRDIMRISMAVGGGLLAIVGVALGALWLIWPLLGRENPLFANTIIAGSAALGLVYGLMLFVQAFRGQDAPAPWPPAALLFLLWVGVLILGAITYAGAAQDTLAPWVFPWLHVFAVALPIFAWLGLGGRRVQAPAGRLAAQFAFGGTVAILISVIVKTGILLAVGGLTLAATQQTDRLGQVMVSLLAGNLGALGELRNAPVLFFLVVVALVFVTPLVDQAAKALTIPWWAGWEPTRERALVWGLAAGLGFAFTEGIFSAAIITTESAWWPTLLARGGVALVQGMTTAVVGVAWWSGFSQRRRFNLVLGYLGAVFLHGLWNVTTIARAVVANVPLTTVTSQTQEPAVDVLIADLLGMGGGFLVLALLVGLLLRWTTRSRWAENT